MWRYWLIGCYAAVLWQPAQAAPDMGAAPQMLLNTGFEHGDADTAADWGLWPPRGRHQGVRSIRDSQQKHSGRFSGRLQVTDPDFEGGCTWHHNAVPVTAGQEIVLSLWLKASEVAGSCGCDVQLRQGTQKLVGSRAMPSLEGSFGWRHITHRVVIPDGVDHICVVPFLRGTGVVWVDDVLAYGTPEMTPVGLAEEQAPTIDGKLDDDCWTQHPGLSGFTTAQGLQAPQRGTAVWAACTPSTLYFAFDCLKKPGDALKATVTQRDGPVWTDDDVELFLNPRGDRSEYFQFVVNPIGTRYDSRGTDASWSIPWQAATTQAEDRWCVEIAIPVSELPVDVLVGEDWCANFGRADKCGGQASAWSATFGGFHNPGRFGTLSGLKLDLKPLWVRDAEARVASVRAEYDRCLEGLAPDDAPAAIAAPVREGQREVRSGLAELTAILDAPQDVKREQWLGLGPRVATLTQQIAQLGADSLRLRTFTVWRQSPTDKPPFGLAVASPMEKVFRDADGFAGRFPDELSLWAARNEFEAAQVVAVSLGDEDIEGCRAQVSDLAGPDGATIGPDNLTTSIVGYIRTREPGYVTTRVGEWPDPLLPNRPFTLRAGQVQPVWLRVYVPPGTPAGRYGGTIEVSGGGRRLHLPIALNVLNFDLPRRQHLATPMGCGPAELAQWYTGDRNYLDKLPTDVFTRWNRFLLDYRITPTRVGRAYIREKQDQDGSISYDYSATDACLEAVADRLPEKGTNMAGVGHFGWQAAKGALLQYVTQQPHGGRRAGVMQWPQTSSWASLSRSLPAQLLAKRNCKAFRFWVRALDASYAPETIVAFVNSFPQRWLTTFTVGDTDWHQVRIPVTRYYHNITGEQLSLDDLATCDNFQFVISDKSRGIRFAVDDITAECEGGDITIDDFELEGEMQQVTARIAAHLRHWKEKGWLPLGHVYGWDEVRPEEYGPAIDAYRQVRSAMPDVRIMQTYYTNPTPEALVDTVGIWCALTSNYDDGFCAGRRARKEDTWLYVCCGPRPPYANFFIDQPAIDHRVLFWQTWQRDCSGFLYWRVNYWHGMLPALGAKPKWPDETWDTADMATYKDFKVNGDGWLVYPWHDWTPLPSVRLENIRDGIEDYEYLYRLREVKPGHELLHVGPDISQDFTHYCRDPRVIEKQRLKIARAIEATTR